MDYYLVRIGAAICIVILLLYALWKKKTHPNFPPGLKGFPIVGVMPYLDKYVEKILKKWSLDKYGPVMSVKIGMTTKVVLNNYDFIMEVRNYFDNNLDLF